MKAEDYGVLAIKPSDMRSIAAASLAGDAQALSEHLRNKKQQWEQAREAILKEDERYRETRDRMFTHLVRLEGAMTMLKELGAVPDPEPKGKEEP